MNNTDDKYLNCHLCPRECGVNRVLKKGYCGEPDTPHVAWIGLHKGEEEPVSGENGSGMFFFTGCTLGCPTCQNIQISNSFRDKTLGKFLSSDEIAKYMLLLEKKGANTISFVTAEHFAPSVAESVKIARSNGLKIKTVFNTSGFMKRSTIEFLLPYVDIWLWDMKTLSPFIAKSYFGLENYPKVEEEGIKVLVNNNADVIVRHLVLPSFIKESIDVIKHFGKNYKNNCAFSLMYQFIPPKSTTDKKILKKLTPTDIEFLENTVFDEGIENGYIQEMSENEEIWQPDFKKSNPFPDGFAIPLLDKC